MKDVKQCSISSVAFTLEVDAYQTLHNYIESIRAHYRDDEDGEEILFDINTNDTIQTEGDSGGLKEQRPHVAQHNSSTPPPY